MENQKKHCTECGAEIEDSWTYCKNCGKEFENKDVTEKNTIKIDSTIKNNQKSNSKLPIIASILFFITTLVLIIVVIIGYLKIEELNEEISTKETRITSLENKNKELNSDISELRVEKNNLEDKAEFLDEKIVFVLEGYGNYYYTYDQVKQVTAGNKYSFWAYNIGAAQSLGYKAFNQ